MTDETLNISYIINILGENEANGVSAGSPVVAGVYDRPRMVAGCRTII